MNRQLIRLKRRTDDQVLQVAECDDNDNLYVNVAAGNINVGTVTSVTDVVNVQDVDSVNLVDRVTLIDEVTNVSDVDSVNLVDAVTSITNTVNTRDDERYSTYFYSSGYTTIESGTEEYEFDELTVPYDATYLDKMGTLSIANLSGFYSLNVQVRQVLTIGGSALRVATHQFTAPPVEKVRPTTTAYSSCVTYNKTGPAWTDESINFDSEVGYNATFPITEVDDAIYFGCKSKFNSLSVYVMTAGVYDATLVWEFWNGTSWVSPTILADNSNELQSTGGQYYLVVFEGLTNWTANQPDAASMVNQYWLRLRCSAFTSKTTDPVIRTALFKPVQYNSITPYDLNEVFGNASTTTQILISPTSDVDDTHELIYNVSIGAKV